MAGQQNTEQQTTVGAHLKRLRGEKNLSTGEIAARMYIHAKIIEALEQDDHDALPDPPYVYGYLRHYARILDVPADEIVAMYRQDTTQPREQAAKTRTKAASKTRQPVKWLYMLMYLGIFMLILAAFALWRGRYAQETVENTSRSGSPPATVVKHTQEPSSAAGKDAETTQAGPPTTPEARPQPQPPQEPEATGATEPVVENADDPDPGTEPAAETQTVTDESEPETAPTFEPTTISAGNGPDTLRLVVTIDCWIEIFDVNNEKVYYDLGRAGQTLILSGLAPFSVLLGNADAATVEFNNTPVDLTPHVTRIGIARFTLGEAE